MSLKTLITKSVQYNNWVINKYLDWLSTKSEEQLNQEVPSSFSTILKTLNHIWQTQEYWWSHISESNDLILKKHAIKKRIFSTPSERVAKSSKIMWKVYRNWI